MSATIPDITAEAKPPEDQEEPTTKSVWFSALHTLRGDAGQALVDAVARTLDEHAFASSKRLKKRRKDTIPMWRRVVEAQTAGLAKVHLGGFSGGLVTPLRKGGEKFRFEPAVTGTFIAARLSSNHTDKPLPAHIMIAVAHDMEACGLTTRNIGRHGGPRTTLHPTRRFAEFVGEHRVELGAVHEENSRELIELRAPKVRPDEGGELLPYEDTDMTRAMRCEMEELNAWLEGADLGLARAIPQVETSQRRLRRVFHRPRRPDSGYREFDLGGRLYGGFWQNMEASLRLACVRIDGQPIAVADYSSMWPRIAYAESGSEPPDGDLYERIGTYSRAGLKLIVNAALSSSNVPNRFPRGSRELFRPEDRLADVLAAIRKVHPLLDRSFGTGFALRAMRVDSTVLLAVLKELRELGIVALPIHDAVAVLVRHAATAKHVMEEAFVRIVGVRGPVEVTVYPHA